MDPKREQQTAEAAERATAEREVQQGRGRGIAMDERLKRAVRQHPLRDEPRVDSVEPGDAPAP
jgi:hypothetical protein